MNKDKAASTRTIQIFWVDRKEKGRTMPDDRAGPLRPDLMLTNAPDAFHPPAAVAIYAI